MLEPFDLTEALADLPSREIGLVLAVGVWAAIVATWLMARPRAGYALRVALGMLVLFASLRLYSASSFVWGGSIESPEVWGVLRLGVLSVTTVIVIMALALGVYVWRHRQRLLDGAEA